MPLAERRDSGVIHRIHRIQRYTTQRMPVAAIAGLKPKRAEPPKPFNRPLRPGGKPAGKSFGPRPAR